MPDYLKDDLVTERKLLEYINATSAQSQSWWNEQLPGTSENRKSRLERFRLRYEARRSVAQLYNDLKTQPYLRASNVGIGIEQIMGEWLIANTLANTVDLDPPVDVYNPRTRQTDYVVEDFYNEFYIHQIGIRQTYETLTREIFSAGGCFSKWESCYYSRKKERTLSVLFDPFTKQPLMQPGQDGKPQPIPADPETPPEQLPLAPDGMTRMMVGQMSGVEPVVNPLFGQYGWHPKLRIRTIEQIDVPPSATTQDPDTWDYYHETYTVSAWYFLGREGEMRDGRIPKERLERLWRVLGITPEQAWLQPNSKLVMPVTVRESHLKFPATASGEPVELVVLSIPRQNFILTWRMTPFNRRPLFNHQVWHRTNHWLGKGIPETIFGLRNSMDALLNQDLDAGNLYNQPPLLISSIAGLNDEMFEMAGPGAVWYLRDINGVKFLPPPIRSRDPIELLNWLVAMAQRLWGVSDLSLNAPTQALSPNVKTATGVAAVTQQANVKFGHFIRNVESVRTLELAMMHQMFGDMWTGQYVTADESGQEAVVDRARLYPHLRVRAVGDGIRTNPLTRQQRFSEFLAQMYQTQNPVVLTNPEVQYEIAQQSMESSGVSLPIMKPQEMDKMRLATALAQTPTVQAVMPQAMQELQAMVTMEKMQEEKVNGNGAIRR